MRKILQDLFGRGARTNSVADDPTDSDTIARPISAVCARCQRPIMVDPALSLDVFEGMHWLCFHLEYEHDTDPDTPCRDFTGCPWWKIKYLEDRLRELGVDPDDVISDAIKQRSG